MPLFSSAVVKMDRGCTMTQGDWFNAVKKQDKTDLKIEKMHQRLRTTLSIEESKEQEEYHADAGKSWEQIKEEIIYGN